ncbi:hypothetical protein SXCC_02612 [Gluconacetobacter sp. SXCC-1]|nr:hypothetical protein SXCC_02612 [Gluconacetobacter sp. SXCC-1]
MPAMRARPVLHGRRDVTVYGAFQWGTFHNATLATKYFFLFFTSAPIKRQDDCMKIGIY